MSYTLAIWNAKIENFNQNSRDDALFYRNKQILKLELNLEGKGMDILRGEFR